MHWLKIIALPLVSQSRSYSQGSIVTTMRAGEQTRVWWKGLKDEVDMARRWDELSIDKKIDRFHNLLEARNQKEICRWGRSEKIIIELRTTTYWLLLYLSNGAWCLEQYSPGQHLGKYATNTPYVHRWIVMSRTKQQLRSSEMQNLIFYRHLLFC